jgi:hypothetical protein
MKIKPGTTAQTSYTTLIVLAVLVALCGGGCLFFTVLGYVTYHATDRSMP